MPQVGRDRHRPARVRHRSREARGHPQDDPVARRARHPEDRHRPRGVDDALPPPSRLRGRIRLSFVEAPPVRRRGRVVIVLLTVLLGVALPAAAAGAGHVPKARCGPGSKPETGLQGEVPMADQFDGRSQQGYRCNLALVGQYAGNGGAIMMAWAGHCAYMATGYSPTDPDYAQKKGVVVIDVSDPRHPVETTRLQTGAMINPWEALKADARSGLLATGQGGSFPLAGPGA